MEFYASDEDNLMILRWLFDENDLLVYETYSENDRELRHFSSPDQVSAAMRLGERGPIGRARLLSLYAPTTGGRLHRKRIDLELEGHEFQHQLAGWGVIGLHLGQLMPDGLQPSRVAVNSEKRALAWEEISPELGPVADWDWSEVARVFRRVSGWIRRQGVTKEAGRPVLAGAQAIRDRGEPLRPF